MNALVRNSNITIIQSEQITFCSKPSLKLIYKDGDFIRYFIFTLEQNVSGKGMTYFELVSAIKADKYEKFLPVINKMINTFEIV